MSEHDTATTGFSVADDRGTNVGPKPTLGIIPIAKKNHFKGEINHLTSVWLDRFGGDGSINLMMDDRVHFDEYEIVARAKQMEAEGADIIVFVVGTWIYSSIVVSAVIDLHVPFILYGLSDQVSNGNLGAAIQIRYVLQEIGKSFKFLFGAIEEESNLATIRDYLRAAWVRKSLRNRKIATVGGKCMMMYQTQVNEFDWKRVFGVDFPQYDTLQIYTEMAKISDADARVVEDAFLSRIDRINWEVAPDDRIPADAIRVQAKMFLAFKRLQQLYGVDVFANKCMPEMSHLEYGYGCAGCLATCMLNEAGITTACEADVPAGLSMYILRLLSGGPAFFADIARSNRQANQVAFFNCGTAPISLADKAKGTALWPIPPNISDEAVPEEYFINKMNGACVTFELENDRQVTMLRIGGNGDTLRFHVANATTRQREVTNAADLGNRWPGFALEFENDLASVLNNTVGHHYSVVYGDYATELRCLAELLGIRFVYDH